MQRRHVPQTGPRYWTALSIASVFGANLGDFVSHDLHMGHARGLGPLALLFVLILLAERRFGSAETRPGSDAAYWLAIVVIRTAATNLGDLATHDFGWPPLILLVALGALLALLVRLAAPRAGGQQAPRASAPQDGLPATGALYWASMLVAGTVGTVGGDYVAGDLGLGTGIGTLVLCVPVAAALAARAWGGRVNALTYWLAVAAIRTAGTTLGDYTAFRHGLNLGLPVSTMASGLLLLAVVAAWPQRTGRKQEESASF